MCSRPETITITLPPWLADYIAAHGGDSAIASVEERMTFVVGAARENIRRGSGGPFAAAVFERDSGRLVALGVNLVATENLSILHAEMVALSVAQRRLGSYSLGLASMPAHELVTSVEPCAMCHGALPWSGISRLVAGAGAEDARAVGFDEGGKPPDWVTALEARHIAVVTGVGRTQACRVLREYRQMGGLIYNGRVG